MAKKSRNPKPGPKIRSGAGKLLFGDVPETSLAQLIGNDPDYPNPPDPAEPPEITGLGPEDAPPAYVPGDEPWVGGGPGRLKGSARAKVPRTLLDRWLLRAKAASRGIDLRGSGLAAAEAAPTTLLGKGAAFAGKHWGTTAGVALPLLLQLAEPAIRSLPGSQNSELQRQLTLSKLASQGNYIKQRRRQELNSLIQQNMALLSQQSPDLAQQLMAGYVLPEDATVIGGQPRMDLLRSVATRMASGEFSPQDAGVPDRMIPGFPLGPDPMMQQGQQPQQGGVA